MSLDDEINQYLASLAEVNLQELKIKFGQIVQPVGTTSSHAKDLLQDEFPRLEGEKVEDWQHRVTKLILGES